MPPMGKEVVVTITQIESVVTPSGNKKVTFSKK
jgi:hypothetical protein